MSTKTSDTDQTIKSLDSFYCASVVVSLWASVSRRIAGPSNALNSNPTAIQR